MLISQDLRRRIVSAYERKEGGKLRLAKRFAVSVSTVKRIVKIKIETGDIKPKPHGGGLKHLIPDSELQRLRNLVAEKSDRTTKELIEQWLIRTGVKVSHSTMIRALQRAKLTIKKRHLERMSAIPKRTRKDGRNSRLNSKTILQKNEST